MLVLSALYSPLFASLAETYGFVCQMTEAKNTKPPSNCTWQTTLNNFYLLAVAVDRKGRWSEFSELLEPSDLFFSTRVIKMPVNWCRCISWMKNREYTGWEKHTIYSRSDVSHWILSFIRCTLRQPSKRSVWWLWTSGTHYWMTFTTLSFVCQTENTFYCCVLVMIYPLQRLCSDF